MSGARAVVTGGAGFLGSHLCERLLNEGWEVLCLDSLLTGNRGNLTRLETRDGFTFSEQNVVDEITIDGDVDYVLHFASPASPKDYLDYPIQTLKVGALGTWRTLGLARAKDAVYMLAS